MIEKVNDNSYQIKKIILGNGDIVNVEKTPHIVIIKDIQEDNYFEFKISHSFQTKKDMLAFSNQCFMMANVINWMDKEQLTFEEGCSKYDKMIEEARSEL